MEHTILLAENAESSRKRWEDFLKGAGYTVALASTPEEARSVLESRKVDLAVIDVRMENDMSEADISGLELAADPIFRPIPKIMLTGHRPPPYSDLRKVWEPIGGEPPAVVAFVGKEEGPQILLQEIHRALEIWPRLSLLASKVSDQIKADHLIIRTQAKQNYAVSLVFSIVGFLFISAGILLAFTQALEIGIVSSASGLLLEALGYLFFRQLENANRRMDVYHQELLQTYGVEFLLSVAARLPADRENGCIERAVDSVLNSWYPSDNRTGARPAVESSSMGEMESHPGVGGSKS
jgi:CheY-like chemotaxis protein